MKHLRIFETEQQRTSILNGATYSILHKLAGQKGITLTIYTPGPKPVTTNNIIFKFVTTEPNESVMFIKGGGESEDPAYFGNGFSCMIKDGTTISENFLSEYIEFAEAGEHTVELVAKDNFYGNLPNYWLQGCQCTEVIVGNSVTSIGNYAFYNCTVLTSVDIGTSATTIGKSAFQGCSSLTSVIIGNSVTSIGEYAFISCSSLTSVTCVRETPSTVVNSSFANTNNCPIYVPAASVDAYKAASGWSTYASRIQAIQ